MQTQEDLAQSRRDAKVGLTQFIPSSFAPWRLCARPSSSSGQSSGKGMVGNGMMEIRTWLHSSARHSLAILFLTERQRARNPTSEGER
jgi:hypothetical protein